MDWRWCRDQIQLCYDDIQTYPEVLSKEVWLTEFGGLRAANMKEDINHCVGLVSWMRRQPFIKRWFWFTIHSDYYWENGILELLDANAQPTELGLVAGRLARMDRFDEVCGYPATDGFGSWDTYVRDGWSGTTLMNEVKSDYLKLSLVNGTTYTANTMRGARVSLSGPAYHISFDYSTNYDNTKVLLAMDTDIGGEVWSLDEFGTNGGHVEMDLTGVREISFGLYVVSTYTFPYPTDEWHGTIRNVIIYYRPEPATSVDTYGHYR